MNKFILKDIVLKFYCGLYEEEKIKKNEFIINFEYYTNDFIDYTQIYETIILIVNRKKWDTLEELSKIIVKEIKRKYSSIEKCKIIIEKLKPMNMNCKSVIIEYGE